MLVRYQCALGEMVPMEGGDWVKYDDVAALLNADTPVVLSGHDLEWWEKLWNGYPKSSDYQGSIPISAKKPTLDRFKRNMAKHRVTSEQLVRAISDYVVDMKSKKNYLVSLQTLLGEQKAYWVEYLKRGE